MTTTSPDRVGQSRRRGPPRVGFFGLLGRGNLGNDGSLDAVVLYLRKQHPDAQLGFMGSCPADLSARYGAPASRLRWYYSDLMAPRGVIGAAIRTLGASVGLGVDAVRIARWVRRYDIVIVPGMGVLEASLPLRAWHTPYSLFVLSAVGRIFRTKVALISVGAGIINGRAMRWLITGAARHAYYRSFRDTTSRDAMQAMGLRVVVNDPVYPDLAFWLPTPPDNTGKPGTVGVGVMDYSGGNDDRAQASEIHAAYVNMMKQFVRWLVDSGRPVRLLVGDVDDEPVVREILADLRASRPDADPGQVVYEPAASLDDVMRQMASVDTVVAMRFHNVVCSLRMGKPTLAIGYARKHDALMAQLGVPEFSEQVKSVDLARLIERFTELEGRAAHVRQVLTVQAAVQRQLLDDQFARLSALLLPGAVSRGVPAPRGATSSVERRSVPAAMEGESYE